jgi:hypothetical protein
MASIDERVKRIPEFHSGSIKKVYRATITREQLTELLAGKSVEIFNRSDMVAVRINLESAEWCIRPEEKDWKNVVAKVLPSTT